MSCSGLILTLSWDLQRARIINGLNCVCACVFPANKRESHHQPVFVRQTFVAVYRECRIWSPTQIIRRNAAEEFVVPEMHSDVPMFKFYIFLGNRLLKLLSVHQQKVLTTLQHNSYSYYITPRPTAKPG